MPKRQKIDTRLAPHFLAEAQKELARRKHLFFLKYCWMKDRARDPFIVGRHTKEICNKIDKAFQDYRQGKDTFLIITVPFRHGKTDIISRYLPPHYLGEFPENEIVMATYSQDLANDISRFSREIIKSQKYLELYDHELAPHDKSIERWKIDNNLGSTQWVGAGGGLTGKGYHMGILDDYLKDRQEAESEVIRNTRWEWFTNVFLTRRAPVSITIILATPWHTDDIIGRIKKKLDPESEGYDENFPQFEIIKMPAFDKEYEQGILFPERFSISWYESQKATLGDYGFQSLLQCDPVPRGGQLFDMDNIKIVDSFPDGLTWARAWDLASSKKERVSDDPDYTAGVLMAISKVFNQEIKAPVYTIYIKDMKRIRAEAPERNSLIVETTKQDGDQVRIVIESYGAYKDAYTELKEILKGVRSVYKISTTGDKISRASPLEAIISAGNFHVLRAPWNDDFIKEFKEFPSGKHDDIIDAVSTGYHHFTKLAIVY